MGSPAEYETAHYAAQALELQPVRAARKLRRLALRRSLGVEQPAPNSSRIPNPRRGLRRPVTINLQQQCCNDRLNLSNMNRRSLRKYCATNNVRQPMGCAWTILSRRASSRRQKIEMYYHEVFTTRARARFAGM